MIKINKKRIAKEWLYFFIAFLFGFFVIPTILGIYFQIIRDRDDAVKVIWYEFIDAVSGRVGRENLYFSWLMVLGPYIICQIIRLIIWSIKTLRR